MSGIAHSDSTLIGSHKALCEDHRRVEGNKWDSRALRLQTAIIENPRADELIGIFDSGSEDELEGHDAYKEVEEVFLRFNLPPARTLGALQRGRGYMSGSGVLAAQAKMLDLPPFKPGDIDFYIQDKESENFKDFLLESGERRLIKEVDFTRPLAEDHEYGTLPGNATAQSGTFAQRRISKLWYFRDAYDKEINVIVTASRCALVPIVAFHSTLVMNFVAYFGIVRLYGSLTDIGLGWLNKDLTRKPLSEQDINGWMAKYAKRGYTLYKNSNIPGPYKGHRCGLDEECTLTIRNLFDRGVKVTKFPKYQGESDVTLLKTLEPVFTWRLRNRACKDKVEEDDEEEWSRKGFVKTVDEFYRL